MNATDLCKFVKVNNIEYHWIEKGEDVILFVNNCDLPKWNKLLGDHILDEEGLKCTMKYGYLCFEMKNICEYFNIELSKVFEDGVFGEVSACSNEQLRALLIEVQEIGK
jgi:hypothetical protein